MTLGREVGMLDEVVVGQCATKHSADRWRMVAIPSGESA
jgi:hypothetical protein